MPRRFTDCQCNEPGWCERHKVMKRPCWFHLCRNSPKHFELWEEGLGYGQNDSTAHRRELLLRSEPCVHRGSQPLEYVDCDLCGMRGKKMPVYSCALLGECTPARYGTKTQRAREMPYCLTCQEYSARGSEEAVTADAPENSS